MVNENESTIADETGPTEPESPVKSPVGVLGLSADIPRDVWGDANIAASDLGYSEQSYITKRIARAILAERERCAGLLERSAKSCRDSADAQAVQGQPDAEMLLPALLEQLTAAIRKGEA
jgi:hypothetical protein